MSSSVSDSSIMRRKSMHVYPHDEESRENDMMNQDISYSFKSRSSSSVRYYNCVDAMVTRPVRQSSVLAKARTIRECRGGHWITTDTDFVVLELSDKDFKNDLLFESEKSSSGGNLVRKEIGKVSG